MSTGNDIVALDSYLIAKAGQRRFYEKIISGDEKRLVDNCGPGLCDGEYTWLLWSVKEAAYKFRKRTAPYLRFSALKINIVQLLPPSANTGKHWQCRVADGDNWVHTRTFFHGSFLHTVAAHREDFAGSCWGTGFTAFTSHANQSADVRLLLLRQLKTLLPLSEWRLEKNVDDIPLLYDEHNKASIPVSFSHDRNYLGWSACCGSLIVN